MKSGLSSDFNRGRDYEQQETYLMLTEFLRLTDDDYLRSLLAAWRQQIVDRLTSNEYQVYIEETFVVIT